MSFHEQRGAPSATYPWEGGRRRAVPLSTEALWTRLVRGGYPELVASPKRDASPWLSSYRQTYLERDVRQLRQIGDLTQFDAFMRLLAARSGTLLDLSSFSRDLGVAVNTVKAWLSVLEASWQVVIVRPWSGNFGKRLVKTPRVYVLDTGMLCHLLGYSDGKQAANGPMAGAIFETAVVGELLRWAYHRGEVPRIHFWRTSTGEEVDFLIEHRGRVVPIEAKATSTPTPSHAKAICLLQAEFGERMVAGYVVHGGTRTLPLAEGVTAIPLSSL
jgi:predicted AAA+ superfamily ATPase